MISKVQNIPGLPILKPKPKNNEPPIKIDGEIISVDTILSTRKEQAIKSPKYDPITVIKHNDEIIIDRSESPLHDEEILLPKMSPIAEPNSPPKSKSNNKKQPKSPPHLAMPQTINSPPTLHCNNVIPTSEPKKIDSPVFVRPSLPTKKEKPNYKKMNRDQLLEERQHLRSLYRVLKEGNPEVEILFDFKDESISLDTIHNMYEKDLFDTLVRRNSTNYKQYLIYSFMAIEAIGSQVLGDMMKGYADSQIESMFCYDQLLLELGQTYFITTGSDWPIEAKLCIMMLFNTLSFIFLKWLCQKMGLAENDAKRINSELIRTVGLNKFLEKTDSSQEKTGGGGGMMDLFSNVTNLMGNSGLKIDGIGNFISGIMGQNNNPVKKSGPPTCKPIKPVVW